jgi:hypothetical protein
MSGDVDACLASLDGGGMRSPNRVRVIPICAALILTTSLRTASARQAPAPPNTPAASIAWTLAAGTNWIDLRDIARTGFPVDASPIAWHGSGVGFSAERLRERSARVHRLQFDVALVSEFEYRSNLASTARPRSDRHRAFLGRYEYRRYLRRNAWIHGLDLGVGVEGLERYTTETRHVETGIESSQSALTTAVSAVAAARLHRWSRVWGEVTWANGGLLARLHEQHSGSASETSSHYGGGWLTVFDAAVGWKINSRTSLTMRYVSGGDGLLSSHRNALMKRGSVLAGVTYGR